jgi:hypothetical protein
MYPALARNLQIHRSIVNMSRPSRRSLLIGCAGLSAFPEQESEELYLFATDEYQVRMTLEFYDGFASRNGLRFRERWLDRRFCLSAKGEENQNCLDNFTGSIAVARYKIVSHGKSGLNLSLRESVRAIDQDDQKAMRPPFERIIETQHGEASDIQAFGYEETPGARSNSQTRENPWCLFRQDLYFEGKTRPFLVVHWKHTLSAIRILDVIPANGTRQVTSGRQAKEKRNAELAR